MDPNQEGFPLLSLEPLIIKDTLEYTNCLDVVNMAIASPDTRRVMVKNARMKLKEIQVMVGKTCHITLVGNNGRSDTFQWKINSGNEVRQWDSPAGVEAWSERVYLGGGRFEIVKAEELPAYYSINTYFNTASDDIISSFESILSFLQTIFQKPATSILTIQTDVFSDFERMKRWKLHCGNFKLRLNANGNRVPAEFMKRVLRKFKLDELWCVQMGVEKGFRYRRPLVIRHIRLAAAWIKLQHLLDAQAEKIYVRGPNLSQVDLNDFIKQWIAGETGTILKTLSLNKLRFKINSAQMSEGIETYPKSITRYREGDLDSEPCFRSEDGFDIKRETDGKMATVVWDSCDKNHVVIIVKD